MKGGGKGKLAKPRDFQRNPFVILGEPLAKSGFDVGGGGGVVVWCIFICVFVVGGRDVADRVGVGVKLGVGSSARFGRMVGQECGWVVVLP